MSFARCGGAAWDYATAKLSGAAADVKSQLTSALEMITQSPESFDQLYELLVGVIQGAMGSLAKKLASAAATGGIYDATIAVIDLFDAVQESCDGIGGFIESMAAVKSVMEDPLTAGQKVMSAILAAFTGTVLPIGLHFLAKQAGQSNLKQQIETFRTTIFAKIKKLLTSAFKAVKDAIKGAVDSLLAKFGLKGGDAPLTLPVQGMGWVTDKEGNKQHVPIEAYAGEDGELYVSWNPSCSIQPSNKANKTNIKLDAGKVANAKNDQGTKAGDLKATDALEKEVQQKLQEADKPDFVYNCCEEDDENCFVAGTLVHTCQETQPIETIAKDDQIVAFDQQTGQWRSDKVAQTFQREYTGLMVNVAVAGETIRSTARHPFWVVAGDDLENRPLTEELGDDNFSAVTAGRWVEAQYLQEGDTLLSREHGELTVNAVSLAEGKVAVYNLHVADCRTYTVGQCGVLVHNTSAPQEGDRNYDVFDPNTDNIITDIDHIQNGILWEEKSATWATAKHL